MLFWVYQLEPLKESYQLSSMKLQRFSWSESSTDGSVALPINSSGCAQLRLFCCNLIMRLFGICKFQFAGL